MGTAPQPYPAPALEGFFFPRWDPPQGIYVVERRNDWLRLEGEFAPFAPTDR